MADILDNICDDSECIKFILNAVDPELKISDNDIQYVLDLIADYYADNEMLDETNEEVEIAEDDMINSIMAAVKKEKIVELNEEQVAAILDQEYEYGKKIGIYE